MDLQESGMQIQNGSAVITPKGKGWVVSSWQAGPVSQNQRQYTVMLAIDDVCAKLAEKKPYIFAASELEIPGPRKRVGRLAENGV